MGEREIEREIDMSKRTWSQIKTAATEAAGTAWIVGTNPMTGIEEDPRYLTLTDPATLRTIQAYHVDGRTVVCGATVSLRQAAARLAEEIQTAYRHGGLGSFDRLRELAGNRDDLSEAIIRAAEVKRTRWRLAQAALAADIEEDAAHDRVVIEGSVQDALRCRRDDLRDA